MKTTLNDIKIAFAKVFSSRKYAILTIILTLAILMFYILFPVITIPGNTFEFWLNIMPWYGFLLLFLFSAGTGILLTMNVYSHLNNHGIAIKGFSAGSLLSTVTAGIYATAACTACVSSIFAFLGAGTVIFLNQFRTEILFLSVILMITAIVITSIKIAGHCAECTIDRKN